MKSLVFPCTLLSLLEAMHKDGEEERTFHLEVDRCLCSMTWRTDHGASLRATPRYTKCARLMRDKPNKSERLG